MRLPHPFAQIDPSTHRPVENFFSYGIIDLLVWAGIGDLVDAFRTETLRPPPIALTDGAALLEDHEVPFTYLWPASLVPKPQDWGPHIDLANFIEYEQAHAYEPPQALLDFLAAGEAPIYVGFGSVVAEDPAALTRTIFAALDKAGARGIVSEGWAHLGGERAPAERLCDRRLSARLVVRALPGRLPSRRCRDDGRGPARRAADGRGAVLRRSVLLGAHRRGCGRRARADSDPPARQRASHRGLRRLPTPADPRAGERARRPTASDRRRGARRAIDRASPSGARHVLARTTPTTWPSSTATRAVSASAGTAVARHTRGTWSTPTAMSTGAGVRHTDSLAELGELMGDAAQAWQAGLAELLPSVKPWHDGVVFSDGGEPPSADSGRPVRKLRRWLASGEAGRTHPLTRSRPRQGRDSWVRLHRGQRTPRGRG